MEGWKTGYAFRRPQDLIFQKMQRLDELQRNFNLTINHYLQLRRNKLEHLAQQLKSMNPDAILKRGYSIVQKSGKIIKDAALLKAKDRVRVKMARGKFTAEVKEVKD